MKKAHILLVEDNEGDILLTIESLETLSVVKKISVVKTGKDAIDFMLQTGKYREAMMPDLVLLDINLPIKNGHEVLDIVKFNEKTKSIPIIMLTTSSSKEDINGAYFRRADLFITKPVDMDGFQEVINTIESFLLKAAYQTD